MSYSPSKCNFRVLDLVMENDSFFFFLSLNFNHENNIGYHGMCIEQS